jgi:hypothetical protein
VSKPLFERGQFTDWLLKQLGEQLPADVLLGDALAPDDGGWVGGQPGQGGFTGYTVLGTVPASPGPAGAELGDAEASSWVLRYTLRSFGGARTQADYCADKARWAWHALASERPVLELGTADLPSRWRAERPLITQMGGVLRSDQMQPPGWEVTDELAVTLNRSRA